MVGGVGLPTTMVNGAEAALSQLPTLHLTEYDVFSIGVTLIEALVAPFDHSTVPAQPDAVSVTESPLQMEVAEAMIVGAYTLVTTTVTALEASLVQSPFLHTAV